MAKKSKKIKIPSNKIEDISKNTNKIIVFPNFKIEGKRKLQFNEKGITKPTGNKYVVLSTPTRKLILLENELEILKMKFDLLLQNVTFNNETNPIVQKITNQNGSYLSIQKDTSGYNLNFEINDLELLLESLTNILDWWKQN